MSSIGTYNVPKPLKQQSRWIKFFSVKQLKYLLPTLAAGIMLTLVLARIHLAGLGVFFTILALIIAGVIATATVPEGWYLFGGGTELSVMVGRILYKKIFKKKTIYSHLGKKQVKTKGMKEWFKK